MRWRVAATVWLLALASGGCQAPPDDVEDPPYGRRFYYDWSGSGVLCAVALDDDAFPDLDQIRDGMRWAARNQRVFVLYGHSPGELLSLETVETVLGDASALGLPLLGFRDLLEDDAPRAGVALTFDDDFVDAWYGTRELLDAYDARVTYFVTRAYLLGEAQVEKLRRLRDDGHSIENHGRRHRHAVRYAAEEGVQAYLEREFLANLQTLRDLGFDPRSYAYPFGDHDGEIDDALRPYADLLRINWRCGHRPR